MAARAGVAQFTEQVADFRIANIPVGAAVTMTVGMGIGDTLKGFMARWVPPMWSGLILAAVLPNIKFLKDILGDRTVELMSLGILADTVNDQFALQQKTSNLLAGFIKPGATVVSASPPRIVQGNVIRQAEAVVQGTDPYAQVFGR